MIAPTYRRDQLWRPQRRSHGPALALGLSLGVVAAVSVLAPVRIFAELHDTPSEGAAFTVARLAHESFPAWREHHVGCPHHLADLARSARLDPWGHAMHYTCAPRLAHGGRFAVFSAGADGVFGTADDLEAHD